MFLVVCLLLHDTALNNLVIFSFSHSRALTSHFEVAERSAASCSTQMAWHTVGRFATAKQVVAEVPSQKKTKRRGT